MTNDHSLDHADLRRLLDSSAWEREIGEFEAVVVEGPVHIGRYSSIFRAVRPAGKGDLAIKCCRNPDTGLADAVAARLQFRALERVDDAIGGNTRFRIPKPRLLCEPEGVLVMEWIHGLPMTNLLLSWRTSGAHAIEYMSRAGQWLRSFHNGNRLPARHLDVQQKFEGIASLKQSPVVRNKSAREAVAALQTYMDEASRGELEQSWQHGDFKTDNLLVAGDSIVGIDAHALSGNAAVYDVAAFVNHLDLTLLHPRALRLLPMRMALTKAFIEAFDPSYLAENRVPYLWTALYLMLTNWHEFTRRETPSLRHRYLRACFRTAVRRLTGELHSVADARTARRA